MIEHRLTIGDLVVFVTYLASLYAPINQLFQTYGQVQSAVAGMRRCLELLELEPEIKDRPDARPAGRLRGAVEFRGVTFGYDGGEPVLKEISFKADPGETVAIVGPTGAGKTTLTSLLARFYEQQSGAIEIDGRGIEQFTLRSLRENIAIVLQPPMVLSDTIRANIALGKPSASGDEIARAAQMARLGPLLAKLTKRAGRGGWSRRPPALPGRGATRHDRARADQERADPDYGRAHQRAWTRRPNHW